MATTTVTVPSLPTMRLAKPSQRARMLAKLLLVALVCAVIAMMFVPWQQTVRGSGQVVAYAPLERQNVIEAMIYGRVQEIAEGITEGAKVKKGQYLMTIVDLDPLRVDRLRSQRLNAEQKVTAQKLTILNYENKVEANEFARDNSILAAEADVRVAEQKLESAKQDLQGALADRTQAELNLAREQKLNAKGLTSDYDLELAQQKSGQTKAKVESSRAKITGAEEDLEGKKAKVKEKTEEWAAKIEEARAQLQKAKGDLALAEKDLQEAESKLAKQEGNQRVVAPRDGTILRLLAQEGGQNVKPGDKLALLVPDTTNRAVEIWVSGNDAPLIHPGDHVRLQFEGWPAVQFSGWPSVAIGTFGGQVATVDSTDDGKGKFRVLIVESEDRNEPKWPSDKYLRQGVRTNGWVLLRQVSLGYELWRQLNGFPPAVTDPEQKAELKSTKGLKDKVK